ncbi:MAG: glycosyltransferase family 4 protein [Spirochaetaceae bacterium]
MSPTSPRILHLVQSSFGVRNAFGARSYYIARQFEKGEILALARHTSPEAAQRCAVATVGYGDTVAKLLKAVHVYGSSRFPHKAILARRLERDVLGLLNGSEALRLSGRESLENYALLPERLELIHTWLRSPRLLPAVREFTRGAPILLDVSMRPIECLSGGAQAFREDCKGVDYWIAPSQIAVDTLVGGCGISEERVFLVPFGVDTELFQPAREPRAPLGEPRFSVAFSGAVDRRKGIPELIEAWRQLALPDGELHLYGRVYPEVHHALRGARRLKVRLRGFRDLPRELPQHDLFVLPSHKEGSAKAVYEALASGLPVVTTPEAGSVVRDGIEGRIVPAGDASALAEAIHHYYRNPQQRRQAAAAARSRALSYTWDRYASRVAQVYQQISRT